MKVILGTLVILFIVITAFIASINNSKMVSFNYLVNQTEISLSSLIALLIGVSFVFGFIIAYLASLGVRLQIFSYQKQNKKLEAEISKLQEEKAK